MNTRHKLVTPRMSNSINLSWRWSKTIFQWCTDQWNSVDLVRRMLLVRHCAHCTRAMRSNLLRVRAPLMEHNYIIYSFCVLCHAHYSSPWTVNAKKLPDLVVWCESFEKSEQIDIERPQIVFSARRLRARLCVWLRLLCPVVLVQWKLVAGTWSIQNNKLAWDAFAGVG